MEQITDIVKRLGLVRSTAEWFYRLRRGLPGYTPDETLSIGMSDPAATTFVEKVLMAIAATLLAGGAPVEPKAALAELARSLETGSCDPTLLAVAVFALKRTLYPTRLEFRPEEELALRIELAAGAQTLLLLIEPSERLASAVAGADESAA